MPLTTPVPDLDTFIARWRASNAAERANYVLFLSELCDVHGTLEQTLDAGLAQTWDYTDRCGAEEAHLLIFDRTKGKPWAGKIWRKEESYQGMPITVWGA